MLRRLPLLLCLFALPAAAQQPPANPAPRQAPPPAEVPEPPALPTPLQSGEQITPDVTIKQDDRGTVEEYRVNGRVYMMRVVPTSGPAYYLVDHDGDGLLEARHDRLGPNYTPPQWILHSW
jgi:hypothetical protein